MSFGRQARPAHAILSEIGQDRQAVAHGQNVNIQSRPDSQTMMEM
jgi:hypothetical protein